MKDHLKQAAFVIGVIVAVKLAKNSIPGIPDSVKALLP